MTFVDAIKSGFKNYANFKGVAPRSEFWYWVLFTFLLGLVTNSIDNVANTTALSNLSNLALFLPGLAVAARRLRDSGRSAIWLAAAALATISALGWLVTTFISEYTPVFGKYSMAQLQAALIELDQNGTGPIADAVNSGVFDGSLVPLLVALAVSTASGITLLVFYCAKTKTAAQGNKYASDAPAAPIDNGGTTA